MPTCGNLWRTAWRPSRRCWAQRLRRDQDAGPLQADLDPQVMAAVVATYAQGLWRMAMVDYDRPRFERQVDTFLTGFGL